MTRDQAEQSISRELEPDERLLWSGIPKQGLRLRPSDALLVPFSLFWGGFAVFWEAQVLNSKAPGFFALWGIPFVLIGLYLILGRFVVDSRQRAATAYGVTNKRVLIVFGLFSRTVKSLALRTLTDMTLSERSDGSGTISFGSAPVWGQWFASSSWPGTSAQQVPAFDLIAEAKSVYSQLRAAQSAA